jgi:type I restriction enzyme S subunit
VVIKNMVVPLPPLEEQKRIVSRLEQLVNRAEEAKRLRKQAREEAEKIMQAALNKVFSRAEEEGWKYVKLSDITEISAGGTPKRSVKEYWNGNIPWVKILDIPEDGLVLDTQEKITEEGLKNSSAKIFPKGTILFSIFATIAKVGILGINAATNQAIAAIQIKDTKIVEQKYLFYCLKNFGTSLLTIGRGMAQRNINQTILRNLKIPLPAPEDQKRIVAYLEKISEITKSLEKLQRKTEEELEKLVPSILDKAFKGGL